MALPSVMAIHQHVWPESEQVHRELSRAVLAREAVGQGLTVSNVGGWHSAPDLHTWDDPAVRELLKRIWTDAGAAGAVGLRIQAWANVMRRDAFHAAHRHGGAVWSGIYCVDPGDGAGGRITFARGSDACTVAPRSGLMLVFSGDLLHSVEPYVGAGTRISVAFNLLP